MWSSETQKQTFNAEKPPKKAVFQRKVVGVQGLEPWASCSQSKRATNCANPGFLVIEFCARCGQTCGHGDFLTTSTCGGSACIAGVSRDCGHSVFRLEGGATRSQSRRATNCATPRYEVRRSGWAYSPKPGAIPASLYPDMRVSADKHSAIIAKAAGECKHFLILKKN